MKSMCKWNSSREEFFDTVDVLKFQTLIAWHKGLGKSADPDQAASEEAVWSGSSLFAILTSILLITALITALKMLEYLP